MNSTLEKFFPAPLRAMMPALKPYIEKMRKQTGMRELATATLHEREVAIEQLRAVLATAAADKVFAIEAVIEGKPAMVVFAIGEAPMLSS